MGNQIPPVKLAILTSLQTIKAGELAGEVTPLHVQWKWTPTIATIKHSLRMLKKKKNLLRESVLGSDIPTAGQIS